MPNRAVIYSSSVFEDKLHTLVRMFALCFSALSALLGARFNGKEAFFYEIILHCLATRTRSVFQTIFLRSFNPGPLWKVSKKMTNESKCLFRGRCGVILYVTQWLQVQCLAFRERFKDLNNCSLTKTNLLRERNTSSNGTKDLLRETNDPSNGIKVRWPITVTAKKKLLTAKRNHCG